MNSCQSGCDGENYQLHLSPPRVKTTLQKRQKRPTDHAKDAELRSALGLFPGSRLVAFGCGHRVYQDDHRSVLGIRFVCLSRSSNFAMYKIHVLKPSGYVVLSFVDLVETLKDYVEAFYHFACPIIAAFSALPRLEPTQ